MTRAIKQQTRDICVTYSAAVDRGEDQGSVVGYLAAQYDVQRPAIWKALRSGGAIAPYAPRQNGGKGRPIGGGIPGYTERRRRRTSEIRDEKMDHPRVDRDPCPRCNVRGDIGCKHSRAPLGMMM